MDFPGLVGLLPLLSIAYIVWNWINGFRRRERRLRSLIKKSNEKNADLKKKESSLSNKIRNLQEETKEIRDIKKIASEAEASNKAAKELVARTLEAAGGRLTPLAHALSALNDPETDRIWSHLVKKKNPAPKAAEIVAESRRAAKKAEKLFSESLARAELYEQIAPWLSDYVDIPVQDYLVGFLESPSNDELSENSVSKDPVKDFLTRDEWARLPDLEKNQMALDRYLSRKKKNLWEVGIDYERYCGWVYEDQGWSVEYHGATQGKEDLGIDLICKKKNKVEIVQCKRLSKVKGIPLRENVVAQIFGSTRVWRTRNNINLEDITPVIITSYELSSEAKAFAEELGVRYEEHTSLKEYPRIKCNISASGEKIYHLPMDQQYDNVKIDKAGESFAMTVSEAENMGFRRAFRWKGGVE
jgi:hypothetical protein